MIRGFDARTGAGAGPSTSRRPGFRRTSENTSAAGYALGTPNAWAPFAVDEARGLVFVADRATRCSTTTAGRTARWTTTGARWWRSGRRRARSCWHFQTVHHDVWDYDVPAQPVLATLRRDGRERPGRRAGDQDGACSSCSTARPASRSSRSRSARCRRAACPARRSRRRSPSRRARRRSRATRSRPTTPGASSRSSTAAGAVGARSSCATARSTSRRRPRAPWCCRATPGGSTGAASPSTPSAASPSRT